MRLLAKKKSVTPSPHLQHIPPNQPQIALYIEDVVVSACREFAATVVAHPVVEVGFGPEHHVAPAVEDDDAVVGVLV